MTAIGEKAFANCQLSTISFGAGIQTVAGNAFGSDGESFTATGFYKSDGTSPLSLADDLNEFKGRTFTGNITKMVRSESYTLTFDPDNGTGTRTETHSLGDTITKPADPEKTGYDFQYWMKADGTEFDFTTETMPASDLTLKALWKAKAFTVTYITGTGTDPTQSCDYGSTISLPDGKSGSIVFSKTGYKLTGWQAEGTSETLSPGTEFTITSDITFTAVWKAVPAPSEDDDDGYSPTVVPGRSTGGGSSDSSIPVAAVAIAAGCAAVLALLAMLVYFPKR